MKKTGTATMAIAALAVAGFAAGCGSTSSNNATNGGAITQSAKTATTSEAAAPASGGAVTVDLTEMKIVPNPTSAKSGEVNFDVKNAGALPHEMIVIKTDKKANALGSGMTVSEAGSVGETGDIAAGKSKMLDLNLKPGHYALICNIAGHYAAGMHADFTVN